MRLRDMGVTSVTIEARAFDQMQDERERFIEALNARQRTDEEARLQLEAAKLPGGPLDGWSFDVARGPGGTWVRDPLVKWRVWVTQPEAGSVVDARTASEAADLVADVACVNHPWAVLVARCDRFGTVEQGTTVLSVIARRDR